MIAELEPILVIPGVAAGMVVESMRGVERMNGLYELTLEVTTSLDAQAVEEALLGRDARFELRLGDRRRVFHGVVRAARSLGRRHADDRNNQARLVVVPRMWLLGLRRDSRIFQGLRFDQVIHEVLHGHRLPSSSFLTQPFPKRHYTTQLEETDLAFVTRLAAEAGAFFYFEQPLVELESSLMSQLSSLVTEALPPELRALQELAGAASEVVVFGDSPIAYPAMRMGDGPTWTDILRRLIGAVDVGPLPAEAGRVVEAIREHLPAPLRPVDDAPTLWMRHDTGALHHGGEDAVLQFERERTLTSTHAVFREFDPRRPQADLSAMRSLDGELTGLARQLQQLAGNLNPESVMEGAEDALGQLGQGVELARGELRRHRQDQRPGELYEHGGRHLFPDWSFEQDEPRRMLRAAARRADVAYGESLCPWLSPAHRFRLDNHPEPHLNRDYVPVVVHHEIRRDDAGRDSRSYRNRFECVPADVAFVPERPPRRCVQVCVTATVEAADGTAIQTDELARVRVRFHWDRSRTAGASTCWLRVMQPWAGAGWGALFLPRAGTEVVVTFDGGDPDKPIVLGGLYNGTHPPPFTLPEHKTRSGFRGSSAPGGDRHNELWFDDARGDELVMLRAARDLEVNVTRNRRADIEGDDDANVRGNRREHVHGDAHATWSGGRVTAVGHDDARRVEGDRESVTLGDERLSVEGNQLTRVLGSSSEEHIGSAQLVFKNDLLKRVDGNATTIVGRHDAPRASATVIEGTLSMTSSGVAEIASDAELVLRCGASTLRLGPERIELTSPAIWLQGKGARLRLSDGAAMISAEDRAQAVADTVAFQSNGAAIGLGAEARIDGGRVLLNSPENASDEIENEEPEPTVIELVDEAGDPIASRPFRIVLADGSEVTGVLDAEGRAEVALEEGGDIYFPGVHDLEAQ